MAQSGPGHIYLFDDFTASDDLITVTTVPRRVGNGSFRLVGQGISSADDAGAVCTAGLSGGVQLTTTNEDVHSTILETDIMFDVALMGPLVAECRLQCDNLDTKAVFMGFTDIAIGSYVPDIQTDLMTAAAGTTLTLTASDLCGFYLDAELTAHETWHCVYNGGTTTGATDSTKVTSGVAAVAAEWDILRVEIDPNGDARWYVNGVLKKSVADAVSTTTDLKFMVGVGAKGNAIEALDIDYILVRANRDWTR